MDVKKIISVDQIIVRRFAETSITNRAGIAYTVRMYTSSHFTTDFLMTCFRDKPKIKKKDFGAACTKDEECLGGLCKR